MNQARWLLAASYRVWRGDIFIAAEMKEVLSED